MVVTGASVPIRYPGGTAVRHPKLGEGYFRTFGEVEGDEQKIIGNWIVMLGLVDRGGKYKNPRTS